MPPPSRDPRPRTLYSSTPWSIYSPNYESSAVPVAEGKEQLQAATSALISLQSEQYAHVDSGGRQSREEWAAPPGQASMVRSHLDMPFGGSGTYLQGDHRWVSGSLNVGVGEDEPRSPSLAPTAGTHPASYLSAPGDNYSVAHVPHLHAHPASLPLAPNQFPSSVSPATIARPRLDTGMSTSSRLSPRRRSSGSTSASDSLGAKLAKSPPNLTRGGGPGPIRREKSKLLSREEKKLNHIHSEQKRRATIRHGYTLLCEQVPSLRMAIAAEEAEEAKHAADGEGRRRRKSHGRVSTVAGERIDGRAGPRSESVVLVQTIDYLKEQLATRQDLIGHVQDLRAGNLGPSPWEEPWTGGTGLAPEGEEDGEGSDEAGY